MAMSRKFDVLKLSGAKGSLPPSIPLIIPNDCEYDSSTNQLRRKEGVPRNKLEVVKEAVALLQDIQKPVAVLSICGPYRTGKSYILSRLLGSSDAFDLGHTMDAKTFGIWLGTTALECDDFVLILLDTEGIDSVSAKMSDDASILVMTILLSSYLIYNSLNVPQKSDLEKMSCFTKLSTGVVVREGQKNQKNDFRPHFPDFLWLLRDVHLLPVDEEGKEVTPTQYLKTRVLCHSDDFDEGTDDKVKKAIMAFFPTIECKILPPPSADKSVMRAIATNELKLSADFNAGVADLVEYLYTNVKVKRGYAKSSKVNGSTFVQLMEQYVQTVNDPNSIPELDNAWEAVIALRREDVLSKLTKEYESELDARIQEASNGLPLEEDSRDAAKQGSTLMGIHRSVLDTKVRALLDELSHFMSDADTEQNSTKLVEELEARVIQCSSEQIEGNGVMYERKQVTGGVLHKYVRQNYDLSQKYCIAKFEELYQPIAQKVASPAEKYAFQDLIDNLQHLDTDYGTVARGPAKWEVLTLKMKEVESEKKLFKQLKGFQADALSKMQKAAEAEAKSRQLQTELNEAYQQNLEEQKHRKETLELMQKKHDEQMAEVRKIEDQRRQNEERKIHDLRNANMEQLARSAADNNRAMTGAFTGMFQTMQNAQDKHSTEMTKLMTAIIEKQAAPPPQPQPTGKRRGPGICCVM